MKSSGKPRIKHIYRADDSKESPELVVSTTFVKRRSRGVFQIGSMGHSDQRMVGAPAPPLYQTSGRRSFYPLDWGISIIVVGVRATPKKARLRNHNLLILRPFCLSHFQKANSPPTRRLDDLKRLTLRFPKRLSTLGLRWPFDIQVELDCSSLEISDRVRKDIFI